MNEQFGIIISPTPNEIAEDLAQLKESCEDESQYNAEEEQYKQEFISEWVSSSQMSDCMTDYTAEMLWEDTLDEYKDKDFFELSRLFIVEQLEWYKRKIATDIMKNEDFFKFLNENNKKEFKKLIKLQEDLCLIKEI
jgi:hypothetical protein